MRKSKNLTILVGSYSSASGRIRKALSNFIENLVSGSISYPLYNLTWKQVVCSVSDSLKEMINEKE